MKKTVKTSIIIFIAFLAVFNSFAGTNEDAFKNANTLYAAGKYSEAAVIYEEIAKQGVTSAELYYNLGNAYYKSGNAARAVLNYERSLRLDPGSDDTRHNLKLANEKTIDQIVQNEDFFIYHGIDVAASKFSAAAWGRISLVVFFLASIFMAGYTFFKKKNLRKLSFFSALSFLGIGIFVFFLALHQEHKNDLKEAVIITEIADINSEPSEKAAKLFNLHEGTKVKVIETDAAWYNIQLPDGKKGWVYSSKIEII